MIELVALDFLSVLIERVGSTILLQMRLPGQIDPSGTPKMLNDDVGVLFCNARRWRSFGWHWLTQGAAHVTKTKTRHRTILDCRSPGKMSSLAHGEPRRMETPTIRPMSWQWLEIDQFNGGSFKQIVTRETEQIKILSNEFTKCYTFRGNPIAYEKFWVVWTLSLCVCVIEIEIEGFDIVLLHLPSLTVKCLTIYTVFVPIGFASAPAGQLSLQRSVSLLLRIYYSIEMLSPHSMCLTFV